MPTTTDKTEHPDQDASLSEASAGIGATYRACCPGTPRTGAKRRTWTAETAVGIRVPEVQVPPQACAGRS
jgi:hypothetical protein